MDEKEKRKMPAIVLVGIGGGGSRILSEGLEKIVRYPHVDRYACLIRAVNASPDKAYQSPSKALDSSSEPHVFILDTSSDPTTEGFYQNIPVKHKISLSSSVQGMSRGAGGRPGRAAKAVLNKEVSETLARELYKPISDIGPAIVVFIHTLDGGTGGGLTPEILQQLAYVLPASTVFWVFSVMPTQTPISLQGPRAVALNVGRMLNTIRRVSDRDYDQIPFECREAIRSLVETKQEDQSYEFRHSRVAMFPMSNQHFSQCLEGQKSVEIREEILNPFPVEMISQALYPFLKYVESTPDEQQWMQKQWPMGPIDIPDIMAGVSPDRPMVLPHLWIDPEPGDKAVVDAAIEDLKNGVIRMTRIEGTTKDGLPDLFSFNGAPCALYEFRASSVYCIPVYPECSKYFDTFGETISDVWFPRLSGKMHFIGGRTGVKVGVINHSANLKPQPIPRPPNTVLGFEHGMLVTLINGGVPSDLLAWLNATKDIMREHRTEDMWELTFYDANDALNEVARYMGIDDWLNKE